MTFWGEPSLPLPLETMGGRLEAEGDAVEQARREMPSSLQEYLAQFEALVAKHGTPSRYEQRLLQRMRARLHLGRNDAPAASRELSNWLEEGPGAFDALPDIDIAIAVLRAGGRLGEVAPWLERRRVLTGPAADHAC